MQHEYTLCVGDLWTPAAAAAFNELSHCIICSPCLRCFNHRKLTILRTDFLSQDLAMLFASLMTMMHPCNWLLNTCLEMDLIS